MCMFWTIGCFMGLLCIVEAFAIPAIGKSTYKIYHIIFAPAHVN